MQTVFSLTITLAPLVLGLTAWVLAGIHLFSKKTWCAIASWCCCAVSLWFPLQAICRWVEKEDIAAILDCAHAYLLCATVLLAGNAALFVMALFVKKK